MAQTRSIFNEVNSDWESWTPVFTGFGTVAGINARWRRVGSVLEVDVRFEEGSSTGVEARVSFPDSLVSSGALPALSVAGVGATSGGNNGYGLHILKEAGVSYFTFGRMESGNNSLVKATGSVIALSPGAVISFTAKCPIQGWSAND